MYCWTVTGRLAAGSPIYGMIDFHQHFFFSIGTNPKAFFNAAFYAKNCGDEIKFKTQSVSMAVAFGEHVNSTAHSYLRSRF